MAKRSNVLLWVLGGAALVGGVVAAVALSQSGAQPPETVPGTPPQPLPAEASSGTVQLGTLFRPSDLELPRMNSAFDGESTGGKIGKIASKTLSTIGAGVQQGLKEGGFR